MKNNRFGRKSEILDIAGFPLVKYGSLQKREKEYLLEARKRLFDQNRLLLEMTGRMATELNLEVKEAWQLLQNSGVDANGVDRRGEIAHYLEEIYLKLDKTYASAQYMAETVILILVSRLENLKELAADITEAFGLPLSKSQIDKFDKVPYTDRLEAPERFEVVRQLVSLLNDETFDAILDFVINEERQWKEVEAEQEEVDSNDPLSSKVS